MANVCLNTLRALGPRAAIDKLKDIVHENNYGYVGDILETENNGVVTLSCQFDSRWAPPSSFDSAIFNDVDYVLAYSEEGIGFCGCYVGSHAADMWFDIESSPRLECSASFLNGDSDDDSPFYESDEGLQRFLKIGLGILSWINKDTPEARLKRAALGCDQSALNAAIEEGADVNHADENGVTAAQIILYRKSPDFGNYNNIAMLDALTKAGAVIGSDDITPRNPLFYALDHNDLRLLHYLAELSESIDAPLTLRDGASEDDVHLITPLCAVCDIGSVVAAKILIEKGADVNAVSTTHEEVMPFSPVRGAVQRADTSILELLTQNGLDFEKADKLFFEEEMDENNKRFYESARLKTVCGKKTHSNDPSSGL